MTVIMSLYEQLKQQAADLLRQAEELRSAERADVLAQVRAAVTEWNLTAAEIGIKKAEKRAKVAIKYQHSSGKSWSGRGKMPKWMVAEISAGATKDQFLVA